MEAQPHFINAEVPNCFRPAAVQNATELNKWRWIDLETSQDMITALKFHDAVFISKIMVI